MATTTTTSTKTKTTTATVLISPSNYYYYCCWDLKRKEADGVEDDELVGIIWDSMIVVGDVVVVWKTKFTDAKLCYAYTHTDTHIAHLYYHWNESREFSLIITGRLRHIKWQFSTLKTTSHARTHARPRTSHTLKVRIRKFFGILIFNWRVCDKAIMTHISNDNNRMSQSHWGNN